MLESLHIENIAVIRSLDIDLEGGLCVLTGETGAGKSLLIDSINLLTGGRVSRDLIRAGEDKAMVSALFSSPSGEAAIALAELGVESSEGDGLLLQRVITRDGRSTARINGRAVTQSILREVGSLLINIHGQSDNQKLMQASAHKALLDTYAQDADELAQYAEDYRLWKETREEITRLRCDAAERIRLQEMLEYQIKDIDSAKLKAGEEERLTERRDKLLHLVDLRSAAFNTDKLIDVGVHLNADVTARGDTHQGQLHITSRPKRRAEISVHERRVINIENKRFTSVITNFGV